VNADVRQVWFIPPRTADTPCFESPKVSLSYPTLRVLRGPVESAVQRLKR
jgi:hypothetical protein